MIKRTLLPLFITTLLAAHTPAQSASDSSKPKTTAKKTQGKSSAQSFAAYMPKVKAALAKRWADAVTKHMREFTPGTVDVVIKINARGRVADVAVKTNTSNAGFAKFCEEFIRESTFVEPPAGALTEGLVEIPFTFIIQ